MIKFNSKILALLCVSAIAIASLTGCRPTANTATPSDTGTLTVATTSSKGSGTAEDPWQIATAEQLDAVRNDLTSSYVLTADIDLSSYANWNPIGTANMEAISSGDSEHMSDTAFSGVFDGNGHTISNISCDAEKMVGVGLFGMSSGTVKNLTINNAKIKGDLESMSIGSVVGYNIGTIKNVVLTGDNLITGTNVVGGIAGGNEYGSISDCKVEDAKVCVIGDNHFTDGRIIQCDVAECGGLIVGGGFGGSVSDCVAKGTVVGEGNEPVGLGGIGGCLEYMETITNCTADVTIEAKNSAHAVGGLCGYSGTGDAEKPCIISNCKVSAVMNVDGGTHVGGLVGTGLYLYGMETVFNIQDCSVTAEINGAVTPGTVVGRAEGGKIISCDANVNVDGVISTDQIGATTTMYESADQ